MQVLLTSTLGTLEPSELVIKRSQLAADARLTSAVAGSAVVTARAIGMTEATAAVRFAFPWLLVGMASAGGCLGAILERRLGARTRRKLTFADLGIGVVLGFLFFLLAMFGAVGAFPKVPFTFRLEQTPTANELGALFLGAMGGWLGRRWLP